MVQAGDGSDQRMVDALATEVAEAVEVMSRKRVSLEGAIYLSNVVVMPRAMYRLKLSRATSKQIDAVQASIRKVVAKKARITAAHTDVLFGGFMGCGWRKWQDEVNLERLKILITAWEERTTVFGRMMRPIEWGARCWGSHCGRSRG